MNTETTTKFDLSAMNEGIFITDGGLETTLIFHEGIDLPHFAAFDLLNQPQHQSVIESYYRRYLDIAVRFGIGFIFESPTWRANPDWAFKMGYNRKELDHINRKAITNLKELRDRYAETKLPMVVSGCIGPRGDGYRVQEAMTASASMKYHRDQILSFKSEGADLVTAITMNYKKEALGIVTAAGSLDIPVVISFTVETDGSLPSGEDLGQSILEIDRLTGSYPAYYMINCAHPTHFKHILKGEWVERLKGIRANASCKSHSELDESEDLDVGDKYELADNYAELLKIMPNLRVIGGCCGTDHSHIETICETLHNTDLMTITQ